MNNNFDAVVIGNIGIDTNIYLLGHDIDWSREGNFTENLDYIGQAGGYASRQFAKLGRKVAFIGYVGPDYQGKFIKEELQKDGIDASGVFIDPAGTSRSVNIMYKDGRRKNFYDGKGHMSLKPNLEICKHIMQGARLAHFNIPNWARELLPLAKRLKLTISTDLQDIVDLEDPYRQDFINHAEVIFFSTANISNPENAVRYLLQKDPNKLIIATMGANGLVFGHKDEVQHFPALQLEGPVIDTNGAGDGLAVGFLTSYFLERCNLPDSVLRAQIVARHICGQRACTDHLMGKVDLQKLFTARKS